MALLLGWDGGEHLSGGVDLTQDVLPATSQLDWLISTTAMIVLSWSRATRDLLKSFGWGIGALHRLATATMVPSPRRLPHSISWSLSRKRATPSGAASPRSSRRSRNIFRRRSWPCEIDVRSAW